LGADGLPGPHSSDPTQWFFKGDIPSSTDPLQVAAARLLGYRWPAQPNEIVSVDSLVDGDGFPSRLSRVAGQQQRRVQPGPPPCPAALGPCSASDSSL
jgi:hypothetical protein